ncbi:Peroxidase protein [Dioscorea alata]|uniref:Peroxidase protein n=1 Tax=Dioscorea alata TaxID=55571 RepID=A0ACB7UUT1_DIOAL|nr:Peroxidase protein [Dioscorea alata]
MMKLFMNISLLCLFLSASSILGDLQVNFYNTTCPRAESIIRAVVQKHFNKDHSITPALLRMHFHDCFVKGCDASILIDSTKKNKSEKAAGPNLTVRGYNIIDQAKAKLESQCPSTVSCADIIALATRDAVSMAGGLTYNVPTGRRDGLVSDINDVNLPGPSLTVSQALGFFTAKGLALEDMVILLGAHTVGVAHCAFFRDRLFNFQGTGAPDSTMDANLTSRLISICGAKQKSSSLKSDQTGFLDQNTSFIVDNEYYKQIMLGRGVLQIDNELALDSSSASIASGLASDSTGFLHKFADALVKLGNVEVLEGSAGEIRKNCRVFNTPPPSSK